MESKKRLEKRGLENALGGKITSDKLRGEGVPEGSEEGAARPYGLSPESWAVGWVDDELVRINMSERSHKVTCETALHLVIGDHWLPLRKQTAWNHVALDNFQGVQEPTDLLEMKPRN